MFNFVMRKIVNLCLLYWKGYFIPRRYGHVRSTSNNICKL